MRHRQINHVRRRFLKHGAALGLGGLAAALPVQRAVAASRDRVVVYQGVGLDSLHPYAYSGGGISGIWQHVIEPLIEMDYTRGEYVGVLAESWEFQGQQMALSPEKGRQFP